jgi:hypothetical protein
MVGMIIETAWLMVVFYRDQGTEGKEIFSKILKIVDREISGKFMQP